MTTNLSNEKYLPISNVYVSTFYKDQSNLVNVDSHRAHTCQEAFDVVEEDAFFFYVQDCVVPLHLMDAIMST
jgi:hypothetical protein